MRKLKVIDRICSGRFLKRAQCSAQKILRAEDETWSS
jgi:hypothetical protein